jgi:flagellin-like protein
MSTRHLIGNRKRKGISPVIATVMLVAVAVVIAAALAGFSGSLFGSYSSGPQVKIQSMSLNTDGVGAIVMSNNGNSDDSVIKVEVKNVGTVSSTSGIGGITVGGVDGGLVEANSFQQQVDFDLAVGGATPPVAASGQQVTAVITMASGATITQTITVVAP